MDDHRLMQAIARSEGLKKINKYQARYLPIYKHPLPVSNHRQIHEGILRRVLSCAVEKQVFAAITLGDAWSLEEVYMNGAPATITDKDGNTPVHLAVQMRSLNCLMVLINIGLELSPLNKLGFTPLFLAHAGNLETIKNLLIENKARLYIDRTDEAPKDTVLSVIPEKAKTKSSKKIVNDY